MAIGMQPKTKSLFFFRGEMARVHCLQSRQAAHQLGQRRQNGELPQIQHYHHLMQSRQAAHPPRHHRQPGARQIQLLLLTNSTSHSSSARSALFCTLSSRTSSLKHHTSQRARKGDRIVACPWSHRRGPWPKPIQKFKRPAKCRDVQTLDLVCDAYEENKNFEALLQLQFTLL